MNVIIENIKKRLAQPLPGKDAQFLLAPSYRPLLNENGSRNKAGVILLLYLKNNEFHFPLIERPVYNGAHSGQISFPGGKMETGDKTLTETSLRECEEEIGIKAKDISVVGTLTDLFIPASMFEVTPLVGFYEKIPEFTPQKEEVVSVLEVPLNFILADNCIKYKKIIYDGSEQTIPYFDIFGKMVWGATAMILSEFTFVWKESAEFYSTRFL